MTSRMFGYVRVSTADQNPEMQVAALVDAGVNPDYIFKDAKSGRKLTNRDGLRRVLRNMRKGDTLVVWRFDRLARNARDLLSVTDDLSAHGIEFRSLKEGVDTKTPAGKLMLTMIAAMAQFESDVNSERTKEGMKNAAKHGRKGGRKHYILTRPKRLARFTELWINGDIPDGNMSAAEIIAEMNEADSKPPLLGSLGAYQNWKAKDFPGFVKPEKEADHD